MPNEVLAALIGATAAIGVAVLANIDKLRGLFGSAAISQAVSHPELAHEAILSHARVQLLLRSAGYAITVDGLRGPQTTSAILKFQKARGLATTGVVDQPTRKELLSVAEEFEKIQRKLQALSFAVSIDGLCGDSTTAALTSMQNEHGLPATGLADTATRRLLEELLYRQSPNTTG